MKDQLTKLAVFVVLVIALMGVTLIGVKIVNPPRPASVSTAATGGTWIKPYAIVTNSVTHEYEFLFSTDAPNMGCLVVSKLPDDPTWYIEAQHNVRVWTCSLKSIRWKDSRLLLVHEP